MIGVNFATHAQSHVVINLFVSLGKNIPDFLKSDTPLPGFKPDHPHPGELIPP